MKKPEKDENEARIRALCRRMDGLAKEMRRVMAEYGEEVFMTGTRDSVVMVVTEKAKAAELFPVADALCERWGTMEDLDEKMAAEEEQARAIALQIIEGGREDKKDDEA
jgi:hypothetical protein